MKLFVTVPQKKTKTETLQKSRKSYDIKYLVKCSDSCALKNVSSNVSSFFVSIFVLQ